MKVLVADDYIIFREEISYFLKSLGHQTTTVAGGYEALLYLDEEKFDAVITDAQMPNGTVLDLLQGMKERRLNIPCLVHSQNETFDHAGQKVNLNDLKKSFKNVSAVSLKPIIWSELGYIKDFLDSLQK